MEAKVILFHSNESDKCKAFINNDVSLITSKNGKDDIWLGDGIYFWDNKGNVDWWNNKQRNRKPNETFSIVRVNVNADNILDLTDYDVYMKLKYAWEKLAEKMQCNQELPLGNKLNMLFSIDSFSQKYDIIKVFGKYNNTPAYGIFSYDYKANKAEPTIGVKCIYNIKNSKCILEKELYKEV